MNDFLLDDSLTLRQTFFVVTLLLSATRSPPLHFSVFCAASSHSSSTVPPACLSPYCLGLRICPSHSLSRTHFLLTCCYDESKGIQIQDLFSCSFSDSHSISLRASLCSWLADFQIWEGLEYCNLYDATDGVIGWCRHHKDFDHHTHYHDASEVIYVTNGEAKTFHDGAPMCD